ncbi:MAG: ABC transporter ATP-binding protein [Propionibacteriaceae bacterium]|nr:ABC transporter ATP-binding protein [Propionibacteriaceae bacterium]
MGERIERLLQRHKARLGRTAALDVADQVAIRLEDLAFSYTNQPFIANFNLEIAAGKITSLVGPNGCGKSTLLKLISGLTIPSAGHVFVHETPCLSMGNKERARHLALLPQGPRPPMMSVEALVAYGRYPYQRGLRTRLNAEDEHHVAEAIALAGVERFRKHDVRLLSGGERQRAFIAMILAQDTEIIILDEPTTYLDVSACHEIMELIRELNQAAGKTILMVNHDIDLALRYSDRMAVMVEGKLLHTGSVDEVLASGAIEEAFKVEVARFPDTERLAYTLFPL